MLVLWRFDAGFMVSEVDLNQKKSKNAGNVCISLLVLSREEFRTQHFGFTVRRRDVTIQHLGIKAAQVGILPVNCRSFQMNTEKEKTCQVVYNGDHNATTNGGFVSKRREPSPAIHKKFSCSVLERGDINPAEYESIKP